MYNRHLETFLKVAQLGSFSSAAEALYLTPSAVIQQINALEQELNVTLFQRSRRGVLLTPAGDYLFDAGADYICRGKEIRRKMEELCADRNIITIGTSTNFKVRLLFHLRNLFSLKNPSNEFRMRMLTNEYTTIPDADIVEGVRPNTLWSSQMSFFKICDMPLGCAVDQNHPLAAKNSLTYEDLKPYTAVTISYGHAADLKPLHNALAEHGIRFNSVDDLSPSELLLSAFDLRVMIIPMCWADIMPDFRVLPCEWSYTMDYGIFYRRSASNAVRNFLSFIDDIYSGKIDCTEIPEFK